MANLIFPLLFMFNFVNIGTNSFKKEVGAISLIKT